MSPCNPRSTSANRVGQLLPGSLTDVDSLLSHFFPSPSALRNVPASWSAPASVWEADDRLFVEVDAPGVLPEHVEVTFENGQLSVSLKRSAGEPAPTFAYNERRFGDVTRTLSLPDTVDPNSIDAKLNAGVLRVEIAKRPETQPRKIEVKLG
ncbi:MAG: Hsp20/alpha crystallin family protein [Lacipirellulaceae bacterium]